ncbi:hypothetical protein D5041_07945 [Verminephrobacter aporrectodeae subsp. tuberculatae]|uniref:tail protein X n=1 Tax=Verminephrobacter aporrectodeae TaxID=1110389 RepID=UPI00223756AF|nr:tail protein X [Verminephrobacter aporrectodeae]MCW5223529.1 hypothetical protein [Verminephrobacter aporrectodeae subsp. tuberculatae]MCW5288994.1 hypothetical protein [Verminephrobacter aporrectodeae subsp. tuberculatae]
MYLTHITTEGERWDQIAQRYYGDPFQYERIVAINPHAPLSTTLPGGLSLAVPVIERQDLFEELPPWLR